MKAIGYIRVSTTGQAEDGISLEAQGAKIRAWADLNGYDHVDIFNEGGLTGTKMDKRDALQSALKAISKGDAFIVYSLSRLARSTKDTLEISDLLSKKGADLVSISEKIDTTTAAGKMVFRMLAVLSEFEADQISERTKCAMSHKKSKGERVGSIPYGFSLAEDGKTLVENPEEQEVIGLIREYHSAGMGFNAIARCLTKKGVQTRTGRDFQATQVMRILAA